MIGPHHRVRQYIACIHISPDPSFLVEVGLACETSIIQHLTVADTSCEILSLASIVVFVTV